MFTSSFSTTPLSASRNYLVNIPSVNAFLAPGFLFAAFARLDDAWRGELQPSKIRLTLHPIPMANPSWLRAKFAASCHRWIPSFEEFSAGGSGQNNI
jgi:hypothetical protein